MAGTPWLCLCLLLGGPILRVKGEVTAKEKRHDSLGKLLDSGWEQASKVTGESEEREPSLPLNQSSTDLSKPTGTQTNSISVGSVDAEGAHPEAKLDADGGDPEPKLSADGGDPETKLGSGAKEAKSEPKIGSVGAEEAGPEPKMGSERGKLEARFSSKHKISTKLTKGTIPTQIVYDTPSVTSVSDINPYTAVIPQKVASIAQYRGYDPYNPCKPYFGTTPCSSQMDDVATPWDSSTSYPYGHNSMSLPPLRDETGFESQAMGAVEALLAGEGYNAMQVRNCLNSHFPADAYHHFPANVAAEACRIYLDANAVVARLPPTHLRGPRCPTNSPYRCAETTSCVLRPDMCESTLPRNGALDTMITSQNLLFDANNQISNPILRSVASCPEDMPHRCPVSNNCVMRASLCNRIPNRIGISPLSPISPVSLSTSTLSSGIIGSQTAGMGSENSGISRLENSTRVSGVESSRNSGKGGGRTYVHHHQKAGNVTAAQIASSWKMPQNPAPSEAMNAKEKDAEAEEDIDIPQLRYLDEQINTINDEVDNAELDELAVKVARARRRMHLPKSAQSRFSHMKSNASTQLEGLKSTTLKHKIHLSNPSGGRPKPKNSEKNDASGLFGLAKKYHVH
ncbi:hypothetical protein AAMO2058_000260200 [Amorphochlora amoebiformis]